MVYLWVALGGAIGSMARYGLSGAVARAAGGVFPYGTLFVNVTGAIIIGFVGTLSGAESRVFMPANGRIFLMTGICGGYTTFSTFSLETVNLLRDGEWAAAIANMGFSVALCLLAVWIGHVLALPFSRGRMTL